VGGLNTKTATTKSKSVGLSGRTRKKTNQNTNHLTTRTPPKQCKQSHPTTQSGRNHRRKKKKKKGTKLHNQKKFTDITTLSRGQTLIPLEEGEWGLPPHTWHRHLTRSIITLGYGVVYGLPVWRRPFRVIMIPYHHFYFYFSLFYFFSCIICRGEKGLGVGICCFLVS
jgi:hypothetical protein